jgi:predicted permease
LPGVASAGYGNLPPLVFKGFQVYVSVEGEPPSAPADFARHIVADRTAGEGYLETLGVPLLQGRQFDSRDGSTAAPTVIINDSMAKRYWSDRDPIGQRFTIGQPQTGSVWLTVVGVVGDTHQMGLDVAPEPEFFFSASQSVMDAPFLWPGYMLVRTQTDPLALAAAVRRAIWEIDANQPVASTRTMEEVLDRDVASRNTQLTLVGAFAALALLLAAVGLYGVLSYTIAQRTAEIGLRMALGAQTGNVVAGVLRAALRLASIGVVLGVAGAFVVTRFLRSFLFGVSPTDPATLSGVALVLVAVTIVASVLPALRAARVDPMAALRTD